MSKQNVWPFQYFFSGQNCSPNLQVVLVSLETGFCRCCFLNKLFSQKIAWFHSIPVFNVRLIIFLKLRKLLEGKFLVGHDVMMVII